MPAGIAVGIDWNPELCAPSLRTMVQDRFGARAFMKKIALIVVAVLVVAGLVAFMVFKQQAEILICS